MLMRKQYLFEQGLKGQWKFHWWGRGEQPPQRQNGPSRKLAWNGQELGASEETLRGQRGLGKKAMTQVTESLGSYDCRRNSHSSYLSLHQLCYSQLQAATKWVTIRHVNCGLKFFDHSALTVKKLNMYPQYVLSCVFCHLHIIKALELMNNLYIPM